MTNSWVNDRRIDPDDPIGAQEWHALLNRSNIPRRYWGCKPELVKGNNKWMMEAVEDPSRWAGQGWGFYIHGPFDCGKSGAAACLALDMLKRAHAVEWMTIRELPGVVFRETPESAARYDRLPMLDLLVLDDLGAQRFKLTSAAGTAMEDVARIMFDRARPVIYTSNVAWQQFTTMFGELPAFCSVVERTTIPVALNDSWGQRPGMSNGS